MKLDILKISLGGFANIKKINLSFHHITALLALNNYGKSNVIKGIEFAMHFIQSDDNVRSKLMHNSNFIPINKNMGNDNFFFEIEFKINHQRIVNYSIQFSWPSNIRSPFIASESLKIKNDNDAKFFTYINRMGTDCKYLASQKGRCSTLLKVSENQLAISKLSHYDHLFYHDIIDAILSLYILKPETLAGNNSIFHGLPNLIYNFNQPELNGPDQIGVERFLYEMQKNNKSKFNQFKDAITQLIPSIQSFEAVKLEVKNKPKNKDINNTVYILPDDIYEIKVIENNLNQQISFSRLSDGTKRIFYILLMTIWADITDAEIIMIEEPENSIHPALLQKFLVMLDELAGDTKILITSHSPYLIQYIDPAFVYIGISQNDGLASFFTLKPSKRKAFFKEAYSYGMNSGDFLFDNMIASKESLRSFKEKYFF